MSAKKDKQKSLFSNLFNNHSKTVRRAISGVVLAALCGLLVLAAFDAAGFIGGIVYEYTTFALGVGYWILAAGLAWCAYRILRRGRVLEGGAGWLQFLVSIILYVVVLALINVASAGSGGVVGSAVASAVVGGFSVYAGTVLLETIAVIALLVLIDGYVDLQKTITLPRLELPDWLFPSRDELETTKDNQEKTEAAKKPEKSTQKDTESKYTEKKTAKKKAKKTKKTSGAKTSKESEDNYDVQDYKGSEAPLDALNLSTPGDYTPPPISLLSRDAGDPEVGDVKARANLIKRTLDNFNVTVEMDEVSIGPTVTRYALKPAEGVRLNKITNLQNNLELALAAHPVRIEAPIPGKSLVGIEVPNSSKTTVGLAGLIGSDKFQKDKNSLLMALGQGISGDSYFADLNKMPHLLIGGATGAGKSVTAHSLITSLLFRNSPENLKLIMVDPKRVELTLYNGIPHLLTPVITSAKKAILALKWAAKEMDRRYDILEEHKARDISSYHNNVLPELEKKTDEDEKSPDKMPYIVVVIDEMADLMQAYPKELESVIVRIAQMSRAVGIHLILSTQRPDVNVITGIIKANVPARIALQVSSQVDSRTILDTKGAEQLLGAGDMLYQSGDMSKPVRIQSAFISEKEVKKVVKNLKEQYEDQLQDTVNLTKNEDNGKGAKTIFDVAKEAEAEEERDDKYEDALETVVAADKASTSYLQRKLRVGYSRAARIMDELEENGIISEKDGTKARDVLVTKEQLEAARNGASFEHKEGDEETAEQKASEEETSKSEDDAEEGAEETAQ